MYKPSLESRRIFKVKNTGNLNEKVDTLSVDSTDWSYISPPFKIIVPADKQMAVGGLASLAAKSER